MLYIYEHALVSKLNGQYRLANMSIGQCCIQKKRRVHMYIGNMGMESQVEKEANKGYLHLK